MRRLIPIFILALIVQMMVADNAIVIVKHDGQTVAVRTTDVDSITFTDSQLLPPEAFAMRDTVYLTPHDTVYLTPHDTIQVTKTVPTAVTTADEWYVNVENPVVARYLNEVDYSGNTTGDGVTHVTDYCYETPGYRLDHPRGAAITWSNAAASAGEPLMLVTSLTPDFSPSTDTLATCGQLRPDTLHLTAGDTTAIVTNMLPGKKYYYRVISGTTVLKESHFTTTGQVRMIQLNVTSNVRDLGGWPTTDGRRLRYGRLYRGIEMNNSHRSGIGEGKSGFDNTISPEDSLYMHDKLGIRYEMDLRSRSEMLCYDTIPDNDADHTMLGPDVDYVIHEVNYNIGYMSYYAANYAYRWGDALRDLIQALRDGKIIYFHCIVGADRTGMLAALIEGLCGVTEADICKDYELTSFSPQRIGGLVRSRDYFIYDMNIIKSYAGNTLQEKMAAYCKRVGITQQDIDDLRAIMLE